MFERIENYVETKMQGTTQKIEALIGVIDCLIDRLHKYEEEILDISALFEQKDIQETPYRKRVEPLYHLRKKLIKQISLIRQYINHLEMMKMEERYCVSNSGTRNKGSSLIYSSTAGVVRICKDSFQNHISILTKMFYDLSESYQEILDEFGKILREETEFYGLPVSNNINVYDEAMNELLHVYSETIKYLTSIYR